MSDLIRGELMRLYERDRELTAGSVVEAARDETSPLHNRFEWDDTIAAEKYREDQARELIRSIRVTVDRPDGGSVNVRAFVNVDPDPNGKRIYLPTYVAMADPVRREIVLSRARTELNTWVNRYRTLNEAAELLATAAEAIEDESAA